MPEPKLFTAADLRPGLQAEFERDITAEDIRAFAELSGDWNPLHTNEEYARESNYGRPIAHGAFQVALASAIVGMYLPGLRAAVGSFQCRFPAPLFYPSRVRVRGELTTWVPNSSNGTLRVHVTETLSGVLTSEIRVGFSLHESRVSSHLPDAKRPQVQGKPIVILTGARGGLGQKIAEVLSEIYHVIGVSRSKEGSADRRVDIEWLIANLAEGDWESEIADHLQGRQIFGLVHAAWPSVSQGGLLDADLDQIRSQVEFGTVGVVRIAKFLRSQSSGGARLVLLGSTAGVFKPVLNIAAYSLGKAVLEHTTRLLAPELARSNITINAVAPSFVPTGMNNAKTSRLVMMETAKVPLGRLCSPDDVAGAVKFVLSPDATFMTGQTLSLTGGQL